jgi:hypothetical protein
MGFVNVPLKITVVNGQHHRAAGLGIKNSRQAVFHSPIQGTGASQEKAMLFDRDVFVVIFVFGRFCCLGFGHISFQFTSLKVQAIFVMR